MGRKLEIKYSRQFLKSLQKLPQKIIDKAEEKEIIFKDNPFHPSLGMHKLSGQEKDSFAFRVDYSYRIKFIFISEKEVLFLDIGTHKIYR